MRGRLPKKLGEFLLFINIRFFSFYTFVIAKLDAKWKAIDRQVEYKNRSRRIIGWFMLNF